ncbi:MAG: acylphosphatase [Ignavibacteriae bacterium]|nr:acylphosphatase [Ignavibacteria bacterium]MBI3363695.1 acylphosphatase [Ignavibacteriota bacterium]
MDVRAHITVQGMVQGVGFRYFVYNKAKQSGLAGFVKNLYDGNVEIVVEGDRSIIEEFIKEVKVGPRPARVTDLKISWQKPEQQFHEFTIR